ncbi:MAG: hypothetical protein WBP12_03640 [Candidatus Saccharimonas sp.]
MTKLESFNIKHFGGQNKKVVFFFAGMGSRAWLYYLPIRYMVSNGFHVIVYDFDPNVMRKGDADSFLQLAANVSRSVATYIDKFSKSGVGYFASFGVSMGTLFAIKVTGENSKIDRVVINMTYGSIAENVWTWKVVGRTKRTAIKQGYTMQTLDEKLSPISPIPNAKYLKSKKVLLYLSTKDKILLFEQSKQFKEALNSHDVRYWYIQNDTGGHFRAGEYNMRKRSIWLNFLERGIVS